MDIYQSYTSLTMNDPKTPKTSFKNIMYTYNMSLRKSITKERVIQTKETHFTAGLDSCDPPFSLTKWEYLIYRYDIYLNHPRYSCPQPMLSLYYCLFGNFYFN